MFSSSSDRFFHSPLNKRTLGSQQIRMQIHLPTSRHQRKSKNTPNNNRLLESSLSTLRSSLSHTTRAAYNLPRSENQPADETFVPPLPFGADRPSSGKQNKSSFLAKTGKQFGAPVAVKELKSLLQRHANKNVAMASLLVSDRDREQDNAAGEVDSPFNEQGRVKSKKLEHKARMQFKIIKSKEAGLQNDIIDENNLIRLRQFLERNRARGNAESPDKNYLQQCQAKVPKIEEALVPNMPTNKKQQQYITREVQKPQSCTQKVRNEQIDANKKTGYNSKPTLLANDNEQEQYVQVKQPNRKQLVPKLTFPVAQQLKKKQTKDFEHNQLDGKKIEVEKQKAKTNAPPKQVQQNKVVEKIKQQKVQQKPLRKQNNFWNTADSLEINQIKPPSVPKVTQLPFEKAKATVETPQANKIQKKKEKKAYEQAQDDMEEINLITARPIPTKQIVKPIETKKVQVIKQNKIGERGKQQTQNKIRQEPRSVTQKSSNLVPQKTPKYLEVSVEQIQQQYEFMLDLINDLGRFCKDTRKLYEKQKFEYYGSQYKVTCFYLWYQLCYFRRKCMLALQTRDQNLFHITVAMLSHDRLRNYFKQSYSGLQKEDKQCRQAMLTYFEAAKAQLSEKEPLGQLDRGANFHSKCLVALHKEFKELEKAYRKIVLSAGDDSRLSLRLCSLIEMFCQLKHLNGQQTKQLEEVEEIENLGQHYQKYKHLVVL